MMILKTELPILLHENLSIVLKVMEHLQSGGTDVSSVLPGEIFVRNQQFTIHLQSGSHHAWRKAIRQLEICSLILFISVHFSRQTYPDVIIGAQKTSHNLNMKVCDGFDDDRLGCCFDGYDGGV